MIGRSSQLSNDPQVRLIKILLIDLVTFEIVIAASFIYPSPSYLAIRNLNLFLENTPLALATRLKNILWITAMF